MNVSCPASFSIGGSVNEDEQMFLPVWELKEGSTLASAIRTKVALGGNIFQCPSGWFEHSGSMWGNGVQVNSHQHSSPDFFLLCWAPVMPGVLLLAVGVADSWMMLSPSQHYEDSVYLRPGKADPGSKRNSFSNMLLSWQNQSFSVAVGENGENCSKFSWDHSRGWYDEDQKCRWPPTVRVTGWLPFVFSSLHQ